MVSLAPLDLLVPVVALEKWDLLVLLVFLDLLVLLDLQASVSPSSPCPSPRRVQILCVEATELMTLAFVTVMLRWIPP